MEQSLPVTVAAAGLLFFFPLFSNPSVILCFSHVELKNTHLLNIDLQPSSLSTQEQEYHFTMIITIITLFCTILTSWSSFTCVRGTFQDLSIRWSVWHPDFIPSFVQTMLSYPLLLSSSQSWVIRRRALRAREWNPTLDLPSLWYGWAQLLSTSHAFVLTQCWAWGCEPWWSWPLHHTNEWNSTRDGATLW